MANTSSAKNEQELLKERRKLGKCKKVKLKA